MNRVKVESLEHLKTLLKDGEVHKFTLREFNKRLSRVTGTPKPWYICHCIDDSEEFLNEKQFLKTSIYKGIEKGFLFEEK